MLGGTKKGTGLGLVFSKLLVELMKGKIGVKSTPGVGSLFYFIIPLERQAPVVPIMVKPKFSRNYHFLLAEDVQVIQRQTKMAFGVLGARCTVVSNGQEAVDAAKSGLQFDAAILDLGMPVLDGWGAAVKIRELSSRIPIIILSGDANPDGKEYYLQNGIVDKILVKGQVFSKMIPDIEKAIQSKR